MRWSGSAPSAGKSAPSLGPMIRQHNYEVGPDLIARFAAEDSANERFFVPAARAGHALFDLAGYIAARLERADIRHVEDLGLCTYADPDALLQLPSLDPPRRSGLRPPRERHRAGVRRRMACGEWPMANRVNNGHIRYSPFAIRRCESLGIAGKTCGTRPRFMLPVR